MIIVEKLTNCIDYMFESWRLGGPKDSRFNRNKSGWFDADCFDDWSSTIAIPYFQKASTRRKSNINRKRLVQSFVDNLNYVVQNFLSANSTHIIQPLDVAFFAPLKTLEANTNVLETRRRTK